MSWRSVAMLTSFLSVFVANAALAQESTVTPPAVPEGYGEAVPPPPSVPEVPAPPASDLSRPFPVQPAPQASGPIAPSEHVFRIPARILTRLHALDRDMTSLSIRPDTHVVDGILSMVTGGASIAFGALYGGSASTNNAMSTYLYIYGTGSIGRGLLQLTLTPTIGDDAITYGHMPMTSVAEVRDRLAFGEMALESLANRSRTARIFDASISMATGLAFIPFYLGPRDFKFVDFLDYFVLIAASVSVVSGVITLLTRSDAERRWAGYVELREGLRQQRQDERSHARAALSAMPLPGGAAIGISGSF